MRIDLTGVLEDGSPRRIEITDARTTLTVQQGGDLELVVRVVRPNGQAVVLNSSGAELLLSVKKRTTESPPRLVKTATLGTDRGTFLLEPADTKFLSPGKYVYDVWLTLDGNRDAVIPTSPFVLTASVAAVPSAPPPPILQVVENDTEPLILDFSGTDITGWGIKVHINYAVVLVKDAVIVDGPGGLAEVYWVPGDLQVGRWGGEVQVTKPGPLVQTTDVFILDVREEIA
jgi:hypothetical protein